MSVIIINSHDNVAIVLKDVGRGETLELPDGGSITAMEDIPCAHKIALADIEQDCPVIKYGEIIAVAGSQICRGEWVHIHNVKSGREQEGMA